MKHILSCVLTVLHCSYERLLQNFHLFVLLKNICMYLFGCAGSWLQHMGPSIFTAACGSLFPAFILSVVACGIQFPDQGSNPGPFVLGAQSLSHWTNEEVPKLFLKNIFRGLTLNPDTHLNDKVASSFQNGVCVCM